MQISFTAYKGDLFCDTNWWPFLLMEGWAGPLSFWPVTLSLPAPSEPTSEVIFALRWLILQHPKLLSFMECKSSPARPGRIQGDIQFQINWPGNSFAEVEETFRFIVCLLIYSFIYFLKSQNNLNDIAREFCALATRTLWVFFTQQMFITLILAPSRISQLRTYHNLALIELHSWGSKSAHCPWDPHWGLSITDSHSWSLTLDSTVCMFCVELKDAVLVTFLLLWLNPMAQSNLQRKNTFDSWLPRDLSPLWWEAWRQRASMGAQAGSWQLKSPRVSMKQRGNRK